MDVEVVKSDLFEVSVEPGSKENSSLLPKEDNGVVHQVNGIGGPIKFGSHGVDEPKESGLQSKFPRDAVDDWPAPQQIHSFYFVKYRPYEDPKSKVELEKAETVLKNRSAVRSQIFDKLRAKKSELAELTAQVKPLHEEKDKMKNILDEKTKEMQPLRDALSGKSWNTNGGPKEKGAALCSSEEELNTRIKDLEYRLQHETIPLKEEKQILREINQLESTRGKVAANAAMKMKVQGSLGGKDAIQDQVKRVGVDMDGVREDKRAVTSKIKPIEEERFALMKEINALKSELDAATKNRAAAMTDRDSKRNDKESKNASYHNNRKTLNQAKGLAANKDIKGVKELEESEFDKFMKDWTSKKDFREEYEKRLLSSLDFRQLSRDGRIRNPDEKPLVPAAQAAPAVTATVAAANVKQAKEQVDKPQKEDKAVLTKENKKKEAGSATTDLEEEEEVISVSSQPKQKQVDEVKSKEMIREEELAKARQALERKKKLAEKAAAKAAIKAQKEAEKKLKEKEKKAKKKAAASGSLPEAEERSADEEAEAVEEPEKVEEDIKPPVPSKGKSRKENTPRLRTKARGPEALPKAILKRKRSNNYWVWAVPAAAVAAGLVVIAVGYTYFI